MARDVKWYVQVHEDEVRRARINLDLLILKAQDIQRVLHKKDATTLSILSKGVVKLVSDLDSL
jgi:hypothetical protein